MHQRASKSLSKSFARIKIRPQLFPSLTLGSHEKDLFIIFFVVKNKIYHFQDYCLSFNKACNKCKNTIASIIKFILIYILNIVYYLTIIIISLFKFDFHATINNKEI